MCQEAEHVVSERKISCGCTPIGPLNSSKEILQAQCALERLHRNKDITVAELVTPTPLRKAFTNIGNFDRNKDTRIRTYGKVQHKSNHCNLAGRVLSSGGIRLSLDKVAEPTPNVQLSNPIKNSMLIELLDKPIPSEEPRFYGGRVFRSIPKSTGSKASNNCSVSTQSSPKDSHCRTSSTTKFKPNWIIIPTTTLISQYCENITEIDYRGRNGKIQETNNQSPIPYDYQSSNQLLKTLTLLEEKCDRMLGLGDKKDWNKKDKKLQSTTKARYYKKKQKTPFLLKSKTGISIKHFSAKIIRNRSQRFTGLASYPDLFKCLENGTSFIREVMESVKHPEESLKKNIQLIDIADSD